MMILTKFRKAPVRAALVGALSLALPAGAAFTLAATPAVAASPDKLDTAVSALRAISTMTADFVQTDAKGQSLSGKMTLKRPGKIRFEYAKGADMLIVSNGSSLYLIDYAVNQVQRWPIKSSPLGALLDPNRDVKKYGKLMPTSTNDVIGVEVRDPKHPEYGVITLVFSRNASAPGGYELVSWVALDSQNNRTTVRLKSQRYGAAISDSTFKFKDPRRSGRRP
ncbi:outer membrane lipoprotein carrier protein LolA [Tsuneonella flava]|uniref:Outer membrane lipoprotein carrier protein LolA n=1 Tax=Tsuneonella flava TaxID=2055955 RepID=A0ABX7KAC2_9SPHN|nr:outer membrane lipoprotein carrier protein LolA [Tsuneonella flava]QSB44944.1 outer membrane lipoprotein carrier protein LolA [Tsuneonella flava]